MRSLLTPKGGIRIIALTALIFALPAVVDLLRLMGASASDSTSGVQLRIWVIFGLTICFCLAFVVSAYGLWREQNWGRVLFLWTIVIWCGFNLLAIFGSNRLFTAGREYSLTDLAVNSIRFSMPLVISLWYLNRPSIKAYFHYNTSDNSTT